MKKVFVTALQLAVTIALLIWVFHDPEQRHKMGKALQEAHYRWVAAAIVAYVIVEIAAAIRWQILLGVSISGLVASFIISGFNLFHLLPHKFPGKDKLIEIAAAYHLYARHWIATFFAFGASLVAHVATFATFLFVAYALHAEDVRKSPPAPVPAIDFFAVMPIERTLTAVPISLAGIGLREKLLQVMLNNICGVTIEKAKLIGSLGFLVILVCCAPGGIVYFFYKPSGIAKRVGIREMEREVATMEHEIQEPQ